MNPGTSKHRSLSGLAGDVEKHACTLFSFGHAKLVEHFRSSFQSISFAVGLDMNADFAAVAALGILDRFDQELFLVLRKRFSAEKGHGKSNSYD